MDGLFCSPSFFRGFDFAPSENVCPEKVTRGIGAQPRLAKAAIGPIPVF
jgi:hypothetical protein